MNIILNSAESKKRKRLKEILDVILSEHTTVLNVSNFIMFKEEYFKEVLDEDTYDQLTKVNVSKWYLTNVITELILTSLDGIED